MNPVLSAASQSVNVAIDAFARRADETLAAANARPNAAQAREDGAVGASRRSDIVTGVTGMMSAQHSLKAGVAVAATADRMTGTVLDMTV